LTSARASAALAGRLARLGAAIVDGIVLVVPVALFAVVTPLLVHGPGGETVASVFILLAILIVFIFQMVLLTKEGQTVGKKVLGIRIVKMDTGENGGFVPNVLLRLIVNGLIGIIPFYGLVDILFIFRSDRRCIHDLIAGTQVVDA
jgi:uncharacterized RDD family membrane protein YckC